MSRFIDHPKLTLIIIMHLNAYTLLSLRHCNKAFVHSHPQIRGIDLRVLVSPPTILRRSSDSRLLHGPGRRALVRRRLLTRYDSSPREHHQKSLSICTWRRSWKILYVHQIALPVRPVNIKTETNIRSS